MGKPKAAAGSQFGFDTDSAAKMFDNTSANGQSKSCTLWKRIELDETVEYLVYFLGSNAHTCICDGEFRRVGEKTGKAVVISEGILYNSLGNTVFVPARQTVIAKQMAVKED